MERLLTITETAARCGLSSRQIYKLLGSGRFGPELLRIGRSVRIRETELERWLAGDCVSREDFAAEQSAAGKGA